MADQKSEDSTRAGSAWTQEDVKTLIATSQRDIFQYPTVTPKGLQVTDHVYFGWLNRVGTAEKAYLRLCAASSATPSDVASGCSGIIGILSSTGMPQIKASIEEARKAGGKVVPMGEEEVQELLDAMKEGEVEGSISDDAEQDEQGKAQ